MEANRIKRIVLALLMSVGAMGAQAQLEQAVKKIFAGDTIVARQAVVKQDSDSAYVANLQKTLEEARLNEANMRMEMEQMKLRMAAADSVKYARLGNAYFPYRPLPALCVYDCDDISLSAGFRFGGIPGDFGICRIDCLIGFEYGHRQYHRRTGNHLYAPVQDRRPD